MQAGEVSFLQRVAGLSLGDRVRSPTIWRPSVEVIWACVGERRSQVKP